MIESLGKGLVKYTDTNCVHSVIKESREQKDRLNDFSNRKTKELNYHKWFLHCRS